MSEDAGGSSPKTLADVSHLFFSSVEKSGDEAADAPAKTDVVDTQTRGRASRTRFVVVTGGDGGPGKSTVAVNVAQALSSFGRVGVFDADPRIPNARFYLGLPSWHYLTPLTGGGEAAPNAATDSGVVVVDWSLGEKRAAEMLEAGDPLCAAARDFGSEPVDFAVVDAPVTRAALLEMVGRREPLYIVVSDTGRRGFEWAFAALKRLRRATGASEVSLVVNRAPDEAYAEAFHAKTAAVAKRLLSVDVDLLGGIPSEPGLAAEQRERGPVVVSRPGSVVAASLREVSSRALGLLKGRTG